MKEMPKRYVAKDFEPNIQKFWEDNGVFKFNAKTKKRIFAVDTPPPTISGKMHMGHAFSYSQQDFMVRFKRMRGFEVFYPFGTDDNGLATDRMIEKMKGVRSAEMNRREYVKLVLRTLEKEIRPKFISDWKTLGISCDFSLYYTTINDYCQKISQLSFIDLYKKGREYRRESPTLWCPECRMAIAQVEMEDKELGSTFNDVLFEIEGKKVAIATTRPELLPAAVAVFVHPDDKRYGKYAGKKARVPLFNFEVPVLKDEKVDPGKGTGIVMCCTFGDQADIEWYLAHDLQLKEAITKEGRMTELAGKYKGMKIKEARKAIIRDLKEKGLLTKQKMITHTVNVHERCGTEIEILHTKCWFIRYLDLKGDFLRYGKKMKWYPDYMRIRYDNWIKGLQWDWCISRQRHYGVPFPVWYCKKCDEVMIADKDQLPVDPLTDSPKNKCKCGSSEFVPEKDVMDTWATSSLTPQLAIQLLPKSLQKKVYPMDLRPQAHDIITFWLFNTVVKSYLHYKKIPWKDIAISGFALDPEGKKMSKSKGNIIEPQGIVEKYGSDALRFWAASAKLGDDLPYQEKDVATGQKLITKLWNASRFVSMNLKGKPAEPEELNIIDKWILNKLNAVIKDSTHYFENYDYSHTKMNAEIFFWQMFCDNYLEMVKYRLYAGGDRSAAYTLYTVLLDILKLFAPIIPHITEELYQQIFREHEKEKSIHRSAWPEPRKEIADREAERAGDLAKEIIVALRQHKASNKMPLNARLKEVVIDCDKKTQKIIEKTADTIMGTSKAENITFGRASMISTENVKIDVNK